MLAVFKFHGVNDGAVGREIKVSFNAQLRPEQKEGRLLPLNDRAVAILGFLGKLFSRPWSQISFAHGGAVRRVWRRCDRNIRKLSDKADWALEGSLGIGEEACGCLLQIPRPEAYGLHLNT